MGFIDKMRNKFMMGRGRAKENVGRVTHDRSMQAEGKGDRIQGAGRQVGEQVKDAGKNVRDAFK